MAGVAIAMGCIVRGDRSGHARDDSQSKPIWDTDSVTAALRRLAFDVGQTRRRELRGEKL